MLKKLNKIILGVLVAILCFTAGSLNSYAASYKQTTASLTLRKSATTKSSAILTIPKGAKIEVISSSPVIKVIAKKQTNKLNIKKICNLDYTSEFT